MCIICALPKGTGISEKEFDQCWDSNPDGGGYAFLDENAKFSIVKSMELDELKKAFKKDHSKHGEYSPFLLHFRIGTHGTKDETNVHPFYINENVVMAHNGVLSIPTDSKDGRSDTRTFVEDVLQKLPRNFYRNYGISFLIDKFASGSNKLAFLNNAGDFMVYNKVAGTTDNNRWFSNSSFKEERKKYNNSPLPMHHTYSGGSYHGQPQTVNSLVSDTLYRCDFCYGFFENEFFIKTDDMCIYCSNMYKAFAKRTSGLEYSTRNFFKDLASSHRNKKNEKPKLLTPGTQETKIHVLPNGKTVTEENYNDAMEQYLGYGAYG